MNTIITDNMASTGMRLNRRGRPRKNNVDFQTVAEENKAVAEKKSTKVKDFDFGEVHGDTFTITVKDDDKTKTLYENENEPYEYKKVIGFSNLLKHAGAKLDDNQIEFLNQALSGSEETGKAVANLISIYNAKLKTDAKSSAYQSLVNKYKPLEGEKKETAQARMVANAIKLGGLSKEAAINMLKMGGVLPAEYTVADFDETPLRRTKGEDE